MQQPDDKILTHMLDVQEPEVYRVAAVFDEEEASKFSPEKDPFFSDENLYNRPVVFRDDVREGRNTMNDDVLSDEEVNKHYETELQVIKRKICGCFLDCDGECCSINLRRNKCADACGCMCYEDNVVEYTAIRHPGWGEKEDFDLEHVGHYLKQEHLSGGFDILVDYEPTPGWPGMITMMEEISNMTEVEQDSIKKMAVLAIKRYNKMFSSSSEYRIVNVVRANFTSFGNGSMYFITFVAAGAMGDGEPELFQGKVVRYWKDRTFLREVHLCRPRREVFIDVNARATMKGSQKQKQSRRVDKVEKL